MAVVVKNKRRFIITAECPNGTEVTIHNEGRTAGEIIRHDEQQRWVESVTEIQDPTANTIVRVGTISTTPGVWEAPIEHTDIKTSETVRDLKRAFMIAEKNGSTINDIFPPKFVRLPFPSRIKRALTNLIPTSP